MLVYFCSEKKKELLQSSNQSSLSFCVVVMAIVFSFQWSPSIRQFHDGPRRTRQRSADWSRRGRLIPTRQRAPRRWRQLPSRPQIRSRPLLRWSTPRLRLQPPWHCRSGFPPSRMCPPRPAEQPKVIFFFVDLDCGFSSKYVVIFFRKGSMW